MDMGHWVGARDGRPPSGTGLPCWRQDVRNRACGRSHWKVSGGQSLGCGSGPVDGSLLGPAQRGRGLMEAKAISLLHSKRMNV